MAHYVGDACQPLHGSVLADGFPDRRGKGVHSVYESSMIDHHATEIVAGLQAALPGTPRPAAVSTGQQAAVAVVELMDRAAKAVDPTAGKAPGPGAKATPASQPRVSPRSARQPCKALYENTQFVPSLDLDAIAGVF
jgi:hypothetical protein